ncbi:hypothetical protein D3C77_447310 [compost metagenome]
MATGWDVGILIQGDGVEISNVHVGPGFNMAGLVSVNSRDTRSSNLTVDSRSPYRRVKVGRNAPCPCGSGAKFKYCHGSVEMQSKKSAGIVSINSSGEFKDTNIVVDSGGVGVYRKDDRTNFDRTNIVIGQDLDVVKLISDLKLPSNTPPAHMAEAVELVRESGSTDALHYSKLRIWLMDNGFNMKFWAETAIAIGVAAIGAAGA